MLRDTESNFPTVQWKGFPDPAVLTENSLTVSIPKAFHALKNAQKVSGNFADAQKALIWDGTA